MYIQMQFTLHFLSSFPHHSWVPLPSLSPSFCILLLLFINFLPQDILTFNLGLTGWHFRDPIYSPTQLCGALRIQSSENPFFSFFPEWQYTGLDATKAGFMAADCYIIIFKNNFLYFFNGSPMLPTQNYFKKFWVLFFFFLNQWKHALSTHKGLSFICS